MQTTASSALLLLLFLFLTTNQNRPDALDLSKIDTVKVLLFDNHPPSTIRLNAVDHTIEFKTEETVFTIGPGDGFVFIRFQHDQMVLTIANKIVSVSRIEIRNGDGGLTQVFTPETGNRYYHGDFEIEMNSGLKRPQIINSVGLENYIASVVGGEMNFYEMEALKSQAVVSRTYALWNIHQSPYKNFHLKDDEQNQVYKGAFRTRPDFEKAAKATEGELLTWSGRLILAAFSSTCGGATSSNEHVWDGLALPYLRSASDHSMCSMSPHYEWDYTIDEKKLFDLILTRYGFRYGSFSIEKEPSGRVHTIRFTNNSGRDLTFGGNEFRLLINQHSDRLGLRSTRFETESGDGEIMFSGKGLGHGVGMCQWGAKGFAQAGWKYDDILSFYFSGTKIVDLRSIENQKISLSR